MNITSLALTKLLDRPIAFHRAFVDIGGIEAALFLSQALYWSRRTRDADGWFYKSRIEWTEETGLERRAIQRAREVLKQWGVLEEKLTKVPATLHFKVNIEKLLSVLDTPSPASLHDGEQTEAASLHDGVQTGLHDAEQTSLSDAVQTTPIGTEITSENTPKEERLSVPELCTFLFQIFKMNGEKFEHLGYEVQHDIANAHVTQREAEALVRFYNLSVDSRHIEVKSRKHTLSKFMQVYREQIALALKVCPEKKKASSDPSPRAEETEGQRAGNLRKLREVRSALNQSNDPADIELPREFKEWAAKKYKDDPCAVEIAAYKTWIDVPISIRNAWKREKITPLLKSVGA